MKICRYRVRDLEEFGIIEGDDVYLAMGHTLTTLEKGPRVGALRDVTLGPPLHPGKIVCVGRNYNAHIEEMGRTALPEPLVFYKPPSAIIGPGEAIELLPEMGRVDFEAELAVVIGKRGRFISEGAALDHVLGYTCANDVTDRDYQEGDKQWWRAKGFDTFCPLGPWIETELDPTDVQITCRLNGDTKQDARTSQMLFSVPQLIAFISRAITLVPGDVLLTGTPAGVAAISDGDEVAIEIDGIGALSNPVRDV